MLCVSSFVILFLRYLCLLFLFLSPTVLVFYIVFTWNKRIDRFTIITVCDWPTVIRHVGLYYANVNIVTIPKRCGTSRCTCCHRSTRSLPEDDPCFPSLRCCRDSVSWTSTNRPKIRQHHTLSEILLLRQEKYKGKGKEKKKKRQI